MAKKKKQTFSTEFWIVITVVVFVFMTVIYVKKSAPLPPISTAAIPTQSMSFDFGNQKIMLDNQELTFMSGSYQNAEHTAKIANKSINPSGNRAAAVIIDTPEGSGTFFYVIGASIEDGREIYSTPVLLGDRIKIVSVTVDDPQAEDNGIITVNYLDRDAYDAMAIEPTHSKTVKYAFQDDGNLIEVLQ